jgi:hypothetical protein
MRRVVMFICLSVIILVGAVGSARPADSASEKGYFTLTLLQHKIITAKDWNGDEIYFEGAVYYTNHSGQEDVCVFRTDELSKNLRKGTITINQANATPCGTLPVTGKVIVYLKALDSDAWNPVTKEAVSSVLGEIVGFGVEAYMGSQGMEMNDPMLGDGFGMIIEEAIGVFEQSDWIYEALLFYAYDESGTVRFGCRAKSGFPVHTAAPFGETVQGHGPFISIEVPLGWKQQETTNQAAFSGQPPR